MLDGEFRAGSEGFGGWVLGGKVLFWRGTVVNGSLFHVEQFEIGRKDEGFGCFLTVRSTVGRVNFTVAALLITVVSCLTLTEGKSSVTNLLVDRRAPQDLWLKGSSECAGTGGMAGPSTARLAKFARRFAQDDKFVVGGGEPMRGFPHCAALRSK